MERLIGNVNKFTMVSLTDLFDGLCFNKETEMTEDTEENRELEVIEENDLDSEETYIENGLDEIEKQFKMIELTETNSEKMYRLFGTDDEDSDNDADDETDNSGDYI
tara:strand:- start:858 stop:1178 length:321 start_codon:yes stop_codon:yes gene_type:complete